MTITTVPAVHSNGIAGGMIGGELGKLLDAAGLTAYGWTTDRTTRVA